MNNPKKCLAKVTFEKGVLTYHGVKPRSAVVGREYGPRHRRGNKPLRAVVLHGYDKVRNVVIVQRKGQDLCINVDVRRFMTEYLVDDLPVHAAVERPSKDEAPQLHWAEEALRRMDATIASLSKKMDAFIKAQQINADLNGNPGPHPSGDLFGPTNWGQK